MPAPTIVYDLDGTLADTAEDLVGTLNWLLGREGLAPLKVETAGSLLGAGARALIKRGFAASGRSLEPDKLEALFADYLSYYGAHIMERSRLYPGVDRALGAFERAGWRQAVCTNKTENLAKLLIAKLGIADRFAFICGQDTFGVSKPDARPLLRTIAASGGVSERAVMVGDSGTDVGCARAAHVPVIAVDFGYADVPVQELGPDRVISHFDELMEACDALLAVADHASTEPIEPSPSANGARKRN
ncbi:MAG TPA: HAD-IA family hydrolase [Roseiarcus sp.]|nr:HAD-IA family hydrolase [Roseiarcus sp.]